MCSVDALVVLDLCGCCPKMGVVSLILLTSINEQNNNVVKERRDVKVSLSLSLFVSLMSNICILLTFSLMTSLLSISLLLTSPMLICYLIVELDLDY